jgi:hypothetical protein
MRDEDGNAGHWLAGWQHRPRQVKYLMASGEVFDEEEEGGGRRSKNER